MLNLGIGHIWVYQMDIEKGNPTKAHLHEEPKSILRKKLILRDENQGS